ncbi:MAG: LptF/LptG family permease [Phycisphaera sp.]|nr:MAG: LptF/LptG family permease [Phycisphaera sp.]
MRLLDRSIAIQYFVNVVLLLVILGSFIVVVDASLNLHRYVRYAGEHDDFVSKAMATASIVWNLWWPRLIQLFNFTLGFVLVAALGFTTAQMVARRELVAMLASGISLWRAMVPVFVVAFGFVLVGVANQELVVPRIVGILLADDPRVKNNDGKIGVSNLPTTPDASGKLIFAASFDPEAGVMEGVKIWERDEVGVPTRLISAEKATWDGSAWMLEAGSVQPVGRPGAPEPIDRVETEMDPNALAVRRFAGLGQHLSFATLGRMLSQDRSLTPELRRRLQRDRWGRVGSWVAMGLSLVIALPFFVTREPRNMAVQAAKCAPIVLAALVLSALGVSAPIAGMPGWLSVFLPAMLLAPAAAAAATSVQT